MIVLRNKSFNDVTPEEKKKDARKENLKTAGLIGASGLAGYSLYHTSKRVAKNVANKATKKAEDVRDSAIKAVGDKFNAATAQENNRLANELRKINAREAATKAKVEKGFWNKIRNSFDGHARYKEAGDAAFNEALQEHGKNTRELKRLRELRDSRVAEVGKSYASQLDKIAKNKARNMKIAAGAGIGLAAAGTGYALYRRAKAKRKQREQEKK